jgi:hypothetical protein
VARDDALADGARLDEDLARVLDDYWHVDVAAVRRASSLRSEYATSTTS